MKCGSFRRVEAACFLAASATPPACGESDHATVSAAGATAQPSCRGGHAGTAPVPGPPLPDAAEVAAFVSALRGRQAGGWLRNGTHSGAQGLGPSSRQRAREEVAAASAACWALFALAQAVTAAGPATVEAALSFALDALRVPAASKAAARAVCALCGAAAGVLAAAQARRASPSSPHNNSLRQL